MENPFVEKYIQQRMKELGYNLSEFHYESVRISLESAIEPSSPFYYNFGITPGGLTADPPVPQFTGNEFYLMADNEFYFLVEKTVDPTLTIISDTGCLTPKEAANYSNYSFFSIKEFTGQIFFKKTSPGAIDLEFIRCTPYKTNN